MINARKKKKKKTKYKPPDRTKGAICYQWDRWYQYQGTRMVEEVNRKKHKLIKSCAVRKPVLSWVSRHTCSDRPLCERDKIHIVSFSSATFIYCGCGSSVTAHLSFILRKCQFAIYCFMCHAWYYYYY